MFYFKFELCENHFQNITLFLLKKKSYRFRRTWGWVKDDWCFIFDGNYPLILDPYPTFSPQQSSVEDERSDRDETDESEEEEPMKNGEIKKNGPAQNGHATYNNNLSKKQSDVLRGQDGETFRHLEILPLLKQNRDGWRTEDRCLHYRRTHTRSSHEHRHSVPKLTGSSAASIDICLQEQIT